MTDTPPTGPIRDRFIVDMKAVIADAEALLRATPRNPHGFGGKSPWLDRRRQERTITLRC